MGILKDLETFMVNTGQLREAGIPSVSVAYLDDPLSPIQHNVTSRGEENSETIYQACSISKAITALAVAKLVDQGRLKYETKVIDHIPANIINAIVDDKTRHLLRYVTIAMLLSHRSGLSQHGFPGYMGEPALYAEIFTGKPPSNTPRIRFDSFPGSCFSYSGGGFTLLQLVLEQITWTPFADLMQEMVLAPLNMHRSRYGDPAPGDNNYARAHVTAFTPGTPSPRGYHRFTELAAAGLWTTPSDLLKATSAIQKSLYSNDGFLTTKTARKMLSLAAPHDGDSSMGLGWALNETFFGHSGDNDPGYTCYVLSTHRIKEVPDCINNPRLMSFAIMTNSSLGWPTIKKLVAAIFAFRGWPQYDKLPAYGTFTDLVPYLVPEGVNFGDLWTDFVGTWTARKKTPQPRNSPPTPTISITPANAFYSFQSPQSQTSQSRVQTPTSLVNSLNLGGIGTGTRTPTSTTPDEVTVGEWELFSDNGIPMLAFEGVGEAMRLHPGAAPWYKLDGRVDQTFTVIGLELAIRLCSNKKYLDWGVMNGVSPGGGAGWHAVPIGGGERDGGAEDELWIELVQGNDGDVVTLRRVG
ncbi:hypothetical protein CKM354_001133000 [Cercospora kikuchii]|uniref:Beta-lactamase-related domain-containing protein n=1 Tax=Cercospora kikuchii TaxID=84275 RepID=A0A9P3CVC4_9PEZI|nr:uncharacterized protein CKM354_001133000 [Cercospora kikuchii]GIZ48262.1 hypothetical protein CKM354_001133000 [Cercospora kikuchii]